MKKHPWLQAAAILLLAFFPALGSAFLHPKRPVWQREALAPGEIRVADARLLPDAVWIDARQRKSYDTEHIPGAILLNEDEWNSLLPPFAMQWNPDRTVIVYCDSLECNSSHAVAARLRRELGAEKVLVLKGGWKSWKDSGAK